MNPHATLRRSTAHLVVGAHRRIHSREVANKYYELAEREQQFQFPISGSLAIVPSEYTFKILFDHFFVFDYGTLRDSQLNEPMTRFGFSQVSAPQGTHFYAHVTSWLQDQDLHFEGCYVTVGAYNPVVSGEQTLQAAIKFAATLHCSFHGFGAPVDDNESANSALTPSQDPNPSILPTPTPAPGPGPTATPPPPAPAPPPPGGTTPPPAPAPPPPPPPAPTPPYVWPGGPLGGSNFSEITRWSAGGALSHWSVPTYEGALKVATNEDGRLTANDAKDVIWYGSNQGAAAYAVGDKYAANWVQGGLRGAGYKVRLHFRCRYAQPDPYRNVYAVTMNMQDRQHGLAFAFGAWGMSWVTDLRLLGTNQWEVNQFGGVAINTHGQDYTKLENYHDWGPPSVMAAQSLLAREYGALGSGNGDAWVEMWRQGGGVAAAVYTADPDSGIPPVYASLLFVYPKVLQFWNFLTTFPAGDASSLPFFEDSTAYASQPAGYFGWATNLMAKEKTDGSIVNSGAGIVEARLYRYNG